MSARVHPGESNSSWMMEGFLEFITSDNHVAQVCLAHFTWLKKYIPNIIKNINYNRFVRLI